MATRVIQMAFPRLAVPPAAMMRFLAISKRTMSNMKATRAKKLAKPAKQVVKPVMANSRMWARSPQTVAMTANPAAETGRGACQLPACVLNREEAETNQWGGGRGHRSTT